MNLLAPTVPHAPQFGYKGPAVGDGREGSLGHESDNGLRVPQPVLGKGIEVAVEVGEQPG